MDKNSANISLEKISKLLDDKLNPIHGEIARINREITGIKMEALITSANTNKIDRELTRIGSTLEYLKDKTDALLADVNELQDTTKGIWDAITIESEKAKLEIDAIKSHIGLQQS